MGSVVTANTPDSEAHKTRPTVDASFGSFGMGASRRPLDGSLTVFIGPIRSVTAAA